MNNRLIKVALAASTALSVVTPAMAQDAGDIIVTARRVEERLQDVPISITVFTQEQLSNRNVLNASDLAATTTSLQANSNFGNDNTTFAIRGFVQDIGTAPTVGVYFGDVVAPRGGGVGFPSGDGAGAGSFFDLQNVQVLKGPQGTLQGRNTTGGSVLLVPQKPTHDLEGYVEGSIGNYNMRGVQAVLNAPLGENARMRVGIDRQSRDGYMKNRSGIGPKDFNDINYTAVRASLVVDLTPDLESYTIASYSDSDTHGTVGRLNAAVPRGLLGLGQFGLEQMIASHAQGLGYYDVLQDLPDASNRTKQWQAINTTTWQASDTLTVKNIISYAEYRQRANLTLFGTNFTTSVAGMEDFLTGSVYGGQAGVTDVLQTVGENFGLGSFFVDQLEAALTPLEGNPLDYAVTHTAPGIPTSAQSTFTEELQFQGHSSDNRLTWQAGAYYELSKPLGLSGVQTPTLTHCTGLGVTDTPTCDDSLYQAGLAYNAIASGINALIPGTDNDLPLASPIGGYNRQVARTTFQDVGLYAQASYELTPKLKATAGFRYTWDKHEVNGQMYFARIDGNTFCIADLSAYGPDNDCSVSRTQKSNKPTWLLGLDFKPSENVLIYGKYARGYRTGGVKADFPTVINTFQPEKVDNFELGFKSSFSGAISGIFNADVFYNKFSNQQVQLGLQSLIGLPGGATPYNLGKSRMWGFEADTTLKLFEGFTLSASYTYLNTKVQSVKPFTFEGACSIYGYTALCDGLGVPQAIFVPTAEAGEALTYSPKNKYSVTGTYTLPLSEKVGRISLSATFTHTDKMRSTFGYDHFLEAGGMYFLDGPDGPALTTRNLGILPATNLLDLAANWKSVGGSPLDLTFFATNVTKEKYITQVSGLIAFGAETTPLGAPRMYGMRAKVHF